MCYNRGVMDVFCLLLSFLLILAGVIGCVVPMLPGPAIAYCGVLALLPTRFAPSTTACIAFGVACAVVLALDYVVPAYGAKRFNCSRMGVAGCMAGTFVGMFFMPWGVIAGPFIGAVVGEIAVGKRFAASLVGGMGALLGFLCGTLLKVVYCAVCAGWCLAVLWR